jgi:hypothetical protein
MKESKLIEMKNKIDAQNRIMQHLLNELSNVRDLAIGTLETLKLIPGYDDAIKKIKKDITEKSSKTKKTKSLEETSN